MILELKRQGLGVSAIARALIRSGTRGRFYNVVDLVNRLETKTRGGKQGRLAHYTTRLDFVRGPCLLQVKGSGGEGGGCAA